MLMRHNKKTWIKQFIIIVLPIISWNFYNYIGFNQQITKLLGFIVSLILLLFFFHRFLVKYSHKNSYGRYIKIYILIILISFINAFFFWGQSPILTFRASSIYFFIIYYYILKRFKPTYTFILNIIYIYATIYCVLWIIAYNAAPNVLFGNLESLQDSRGMFRVLQLHSFDFVSLLFFYLLVNPSHNLLRNVIVCLICLAMAFFTLSRMLFGAMILIACLYLFRKRPIILILLAIPLFLLPTKYTFNNIILQNLIELTESQMDEGGGVDGLVRSEYYDFGKLYKQNIFTFLFGNGIAHSDSNYGRIEESYKENYAFHRSDAAYVGQYISFGFCGIICLFIILFLVIRQKIPKECLYLKLFIYYLYIVSLTSNSFIEFTIAFALVLYLLDELKDNPNYLIENKLL